MPLSTYQYRGNIGQHNNRIQSQALVPVHATNQPASQSERPLLRNITRATQSPDLDFVERQAGKTPRQSVSHCASRKVIFTLLACGTMLTAAGIIIRDLVEENAADGGRLLKTEDFSQGTMAYFSDNRVEYTPKEKHGGYLLEHEKLSVKMVRRS